MKPIWVLNKLKSPLLSWASDIVSFFNTQTLQDPSSKVLTFVLDRLDLTNLIIECGREGNLQLGSSIHASLIKQCEPFDLENRYLCRNDSVLWNSLLHLYSKWGQSLDAAKLFDKMLMKDTVSWNIMISGLLRDGQFDMSFGYFKRMRELGFSVDKATLTTILSAFDEPEFFYLNKMIHSLVILNGYEGQLAIGNALITSYFRCGCFDSGVRVFYEMVERNVITWTAMISGLAQNEHFAQSLNIFVMMCRGMTMPNSLTYLGSLMACSGLQALSVGRQIHGLLWKHGYQSDLHIESALMDMYSKSGSMENAIQIFHSAEELDKVTMTVILVGFAQNGFEKEAIQIFKKMVKVGSDIDQNVVSAILGVFGIDTSLGLGKQIHSIIIKRNFSCNPYVSNGLINMYSKCGELVESLRVFSWMPETNSISWNSMIAAFARHGDISQALELYEKMQLEGVQPTDVTFLSLLHACSHVGLVGKGLEFLASMVKDHGISPRTEHYACVVDMLGRAGLLNEAKMFIEGLPEKPGPLIWQALLGACSFYNDSELGKYAADQLFLATPDSPAPYVLLANIYSSERNWKERARTIKKMKERRVAKEIGISWIEIDKKVHSFVVGDQMHPQSETIYAVLAELFRLMTDEGYVPDKRFILYYLGHDDEEKAPTFGNLLEPTKYNL